MSWYDLDSNVARVCANIARIYSIKQGLSRFEHDLQNDFHTIVVRSKYGLLRPSTIKHDFYSIYWTFTGFTYSPTDFCSSSIPYELYTILTRLSSLVEWTSRTVVYTVSHGLVRSRTISHDLSRSCTIANTIIHGHGTRVSFIKVLKIIHDFHGYTRMA